MWVVIRLHVSKQTNCVFLSLIYLIYLTNYAFLVNKINQFEHHTNINANIYKLWLIQWDCIQGPPSIQWGSMQCDSVQESPPSGDPREGTRNERPSVQILLSNNRLVPRPFRLVSPIWEILAPTQPCPLPCGLIQCPPPPFVQWCSIEGPLCTWTPYRNLTPQMQYGSLQAPC